MWSSRGWGGRLIVGWVLVIVPIEDAGAGIGCPPIHNGRPLYYVGFFEGPPEKKGELIPEIGKFVVPPTPKELIGKIPRYMLGCLYKGSPVYVTVELPDAVTVCTFEKGAQVDCH